MSNKTTGNPLVSYPVIVLAASGDVDAINAVLKYYEGYIAALSTRQLLDESGNLYLSTEKWSTFQFKTGPLFLSF